MRCWFLSRWIILSSFTVIFVHSSGIPWARVCQNMGKVTVLTTREPPIPQISTPQICAHHHKAESMWRGSPTREPPIPKISTPQILRRAFYTWLTLGSKDSLIRAHHQRAERMRRLLTTREPLIPYISIPQFSGSPLHLVDPQILGFSDLCCSSSMYFEFGKLNLKIKPS